VSDHTACKKEKGPRIRRPSCTSRLVAWPGQRWRYQVASAFLAFFSFFSFFSFFTSDFASALASGLAVAAGVAGAAGAAGAGVGVACAKAAAANRVARRPEMILLMVSLPWSCSGALAMSLANSFGFNQLNLRGPAMEIVDPSKNSFLYSANSGAADLECAGFSLLLRQGPKTYRAKKRARREAGSLSTLPTDYFLAEAAGAAGLAPEAALAGAG
jgi:hypothetical protein